MTGAGKQHATPSLHQATAAPFSNRKNKRNKPAPAGGGYKNFGLFIHKPGEARPFKCLYPQCTYWCVNKRKIKVHLFTHSEKPYRCLHCRFKSASEPALTQHMLNKHNEKIDMKCSFCDCKFLSKMRLHKHLQMHVGTYASSCHLCESKY